MNIFIVLLKREHVAHVGTPKRVDALRVIAHRANVLPHGRQGFHNHILAEVGVLEFVNEHVAKLLLVAVQHLWKAFEQFLCVEEQVVEVHGIGLEASFNVSLVDLRHLRNVVFPVIQCFISVRGVFLPRNKCTFRCGYAVEHLAGLVGVCW